MNDAVCRARSLIGLALTAHETGDEARARAVGDEGLELLRGTDVKGELASSLAHLGQAAVTHGDLTRATVLLDRALSLYGDLRDERGIVTSLEGLAGILVARGRATGALVALGAADARRRASGVVAATLDRAVGERTVRAARAALDSENADRAWSTGAGTSLDEAVAHARRALASLRVPNSDPPPEGEIATLH
jgi:hypothetical protein